VHLFEDGQHQRRVAFVAPLLEVQQVLELLYQKNDCLLFALGQRQDEQTLIFAAGLKALG
jgi:hypothetical protein